MIHVSQDHACLTTYGAVGMILAAGHFVTSCDEYVVKIILRPHSIIITTLYAYTQMYERSIDGYARY